jgi:3-oxoacyl-[acyl-carrier-protein] synthase II
MGAITPIGNSVEEYWESLIAGKSGIGWITRFDPSISPVKIAGEVKGFNPDDFIDPKAARRMARFSQFAVATAKQALDS